MIDPTAHIDPHWPSSPAEVEGAQASLPGIESTRLHRSEDGVLSLHAEGAPIPKRAFDHREASAEVLTLSKSEIGVLRRCPRRYYFEYELGRTPAAGPGIEAEWGAALHRGLEAMLTAIKLGDDGEHGMEHALASVTRTGTDASGQPCAPPQDPYARAALRAMLRAYAAVWGEHDAAKYEVLHVELPFDLPVLTAAGRVSRNYRDGARREGRMDVVVRERACPICGRTGEGDYCVTCGGLGDGPVWIMEHKSTGKPPAEERFYVGLEVELQPALYFDAARELGLAPAGVLYDVVRRPDFHEPKPAPQRNKDGSERKAPTEVCPICEGCKYEGPSLEDPTVGIPCPKCAGTGRITKPVHYSNPRFGEAPADYEERVYQLAISSPKDWFARRALDFQPWQIEESREMVRAAAAEVAWRRRHGFWPLVGDRYVCGAHKMVCPWIDVCGRRQSVEDDRLFPLKRKEG